MKKTLVLHNDVREIPDLAAFVETLAEEIPLDPGLAMSLNLALEEAVTNVMMYAYPAGTVGAVTLDVDAEKDRVVFVLSDSGVPFDPTAVPPADISLGVEDRPIGGLGIFLVRQIMDSVVYARQGDRNVLTLTKLIA
ncbi:MAG: ATP-binding protein [Bacteroidales bacterium]|nr:ATP-binding protein [Bacteroidales bacterium]